MKKTILLLLFILISLLLISCQKDFNKAFDVFSEIEFQFRENDSFLSITNNFIVTTDSSKYEDAIILWDSSDNYHLNFTESGEYVVIRPEDESLEVKLSVFIEVGKDVYTYTYDLVIIVEEAEKLEPTKPDDDKTKYYTVTYKIDEEKTYKRIQYEENKTIIFPDEPYKEYFTFRGWSNKTEIIDEQIIKKNITLYAVFDNIVYNDFDDDKKDVYNDFDEVYLPLNILESQPFKFEFMGIRGSTVNYELVDQKNNKYIDFDKGQFNVLENKLLEIEVIITVFKNDVTLSKTVTVKIGEPDLISISDSKLIDNYHFAKIEGIFTGSYYEPKDKMYYFFLEDDTDGINLMTRSPINLKIGTKLQLTYQKIDEINYLAKIDIKEEVKIEAKILNDPNEINNYLNRYLYIEGIVASNMNNKVFDLLLHDKYQVIIKSNIGKSIIQGMYIGFYGHIIEEDGNYIFIITDPSEIYLEKMEDFEIVDIIMKSLGFYSSLLTINKDLKLLTTDPIFNSSITWSSSNELILTNEGIYNKPDEEVQFKLTATIKLLNKAIIKREYIVTAKP